MADLSTYAGRQAVRDAAAAQGQNVVVDASGVYNQSSGQTTSGNEYVGGGGSSGGGGGGGGGAAVPQYAGVNPSDLAKIQAGFAASSGLSIKQLDEQIREFDANMDWQKQMWQQQGLPQLAIQQRAADLEQQKFQQMSGMATRQQDWVEKIGQQQQALAEKAQADANAIAQGQLGVAQGQLGVSQGQLGLDTLKTAASLTGPADWIKAANFSRGVSQSNLPAFMSQLLSGQSTATMGGPAPGAQMPDPNTMASLATGMGAGMGGAAGGGPRMLALGSGAVPGVLHGPSTPTTSSGAVDSTLPGSYAGGTAPGQAAGQNTPGLGIYRGPVTPTTYSGGADQATSGSYSGSGGPSGTTGAVNTLGKIYAAGGQALGPQAMEGLTGTEMQMFQGGGSDIGADVQGFMDAYKRSRVGQSMAQPGSMAA